MNTREMQHIIVRNPEINLYGDGNVIPTFSAFWQLTTKVGLKERFANRWSKLSDIQRVGIFRKVKSLTFKPNPEVYLVVRERKNYES